MSEETGRRNLRMPNENELFVVVTEHNGGNHVRVRCEDGQNRMGRIPGLTEEVEERLSETLDRDVSVVAPDEPVTAAAMGAQRIADRLVESDAY